MPVRSLRSSVLRWPDRGQVGRAVRDWARQVAGRDPGVLMIGYFGSYAREDWGVGSDVDLVVVVEESSGPFERRAIDFDCTGLPVPADLFVYTAEEWESMRTRQGLPRMAEREIVWVHGR